MIESRQHKPKINISTDKNFKIVKKMIERNYLNTVCAEARCPNIYECWNRKTATLMILGDICTKGCGFCSVKSGRPTWNDPLEPIRVAQTVKKMGLRHVVITSVDRDDLKEDYGSTIWAQTIKNTKKMNPKCTVEVLTPDFMGNKKPPRLKFGQAIIFNPFVIHGNIPFRSDYARIACNVRFQSSKMPLLQKNTDYLKYYELK